MSGKFAHRKLRNLGWVTGVAVLGFVAYQFVARLLLAALWEGVPRQVSVAQIAHITGLPIPTTAQTVNSRYRKGKRNADLFAEMTMRADEAESLTKSVLLQGASQFAKANTETIRESVSVSEMIPSWWPQSDDLTSVKMASVRSPDFSHPPRHVLVAIGRPRGDVVPVYLYWAESM